MVAISDEQKAAGFGYKRIEVEERKSECEIV
jgi:hypothetical protein